MASQHQNAVLDSEQERPMLEGALTFLVILTSLRIHLGEWYSRGLCSIFIRVANYLTVYRVTLELINHLLRLCEVLIAGRSCRCWHEFM